MQETQITFTKPSKFSLRMLKHGLPCPFIPLDDRIATRCLGLGLIEGELLQAHSLLEMIDSKNSGQGMSLWHAAVAGYGRCFVSAEGRKTKLETVHLKNFPTASRDAHEFIMQVRHQSVAHAGNAPDGAASHNRMFLQLMPECGAKAIDNFRYFTIRTKVPTPQELQNVISHISRLIPFVLELRITSENVLMKKYEARAIDELYREACSSAPQSDNAIVLNFDD